MKRIICFFMVAAIIFCMNGCSKADTSIEDPVLFYYCTDPESYETVRMSITPEVRDAAAHNGNLLSLLNDYMKGPASEKHVNPFPDNCRIESLQQDGSVMRIVLNSRFARLTGIDLILACACISLTVFEISDCQSICFSVQNALLNGNKEIIMYRDDILLEYVFDPDNADQ